MANTSIGGLVSGLDTASIISQLIQLEARPQTMLKTRMGAEQKAITSLQALNTKLAAIATKSGELAKATPWSARTATSDNQKVTVTAASGATAAALTFSVTETAVAASSSYLVTADKDLAGTMSANAEYAITYADGRTTEFINTGDGSLQAIADALNQKTGVRATLVRAGMNGTTPTYQLHVESTVSGSSSGFTITEVDPNNRPNPPASPVPFLGGVDVPTDGVDAKITLTNGTVITSATNTITGLMPGVDVTLLAGAKGSTATITVATDPQSLADKVKAMVDAVNAALDDISSLTSYNAATKTAGPLAGDSTLRDVRNKLLSAVTGPADGQSLAQYGVQTDRNGKLVFDEAKFKAAYAADPATTARKFTIDPTTPRPANPVDGFAATLESLAKSFSNSTTGTVTLTIKNRTSMVDRMEDDIADWDVRLDMRRKALERQYGALEVALGKLQSQSQWLAGQISSLPQMSSGG